MTKAIARARAKAREFLTSDPQLLTFVVGIAVGLAIGIGSRAP